MPSLHRTNKVKSLEEENLKLFIEKSKEYFNINNIFDDKKEQVFQNVNNSYIVLNSIALLSKKISNSSRRFRTIEKDKDVRLSKYKGTSIIRIPRHKVWSKMDLVFQK